MTNGPIPLHFETPDPDLNRLLNPGAAYESPRDVVKDPHLSLAEKKAILAAWASDACSVEARPALRQPPGVPALVSFDEIMSALQDLDRQAVAAAPAGGQRTSGQDRSPPC